MSGTDRACSEIMGVRHYRELVAWQRADEFKSSVFALVRGSVAVERDWRYRSQLIDAAGAVGKDIAEGFRRFSPASFAQFLDYGLASLQEAEERLRDGVQLGYFAPTDCADALNLAKRCTVATIRLKHSQQRLTAARIRRRSPR